MMTYTQPKCVRPKSHARMSSPPKVRPDGDLCPLNQTGNLG
jgi:hypothetical protein